MPEPTAGTAVIVAAALVAAAGFAVRAASALGPLVVGGAEQHWLVGGPLDRRTLLTPRFLGLVATGSVLGALLGVLAGLALHRVVLGWWLCTGASVGLALAATTVAGQAAAVRKPPAAVFGTAQAGTALVVLAASLAVVGLFVPVELGLPAPLVAAAAGGLAAAATALAWRWLGRLDRAALGVGGGLSVTVRVAGTFLDPALLLGLLEERRWRRWRHGPSRVLRGDGMAALVAADLRRAVRSPGLALVGTGMVLVPFAAPILIPEELLAAVATVAAWTVASRAASGLRAVTRSPALRRAIPISDAGIIAGHLVAPAVTALVWTTLVLPALSLTHPVGLVLLPIGATALVWRFATRPPPDLAGALVDTGLFGALPLDAARTMLRGVLLLAVLVGVQIWLNA